MIFHTFALDELPGVVMPECEWILGLRTLVPYRINILKSALHIKTEAYGSGGGVTNKKFPWIPEAAGECRHAPGRPCRVRGG